MQYRTLGRTGTSVSAIGFGGAPAGLSGYLGQYDAAALEESLRRLGTEQPGPTGTATGRPRRRCRWPGRAGPGS